MEEIPGWIASWLSAEPDSLSDDDIRALVWFEDWMASVFRSRHRFDGSSLVGLFLRGEREAPTLAVVFEPPRQYPNARYSYEWRLRDSEDATVEDPLDVLLSDNLGNELREDLESTPGLPQWDPDDDGVIHVNTRGERYLQWPQEWWRRGRPWRDREGRLWYGKKLANGEKERPET